MPLAAAATALVIGGVGGYAGSRWGDGARTPGGSSTLAAPSRVAFTSVTDSRMTAVVDIVPVSNGTELRVVTTADSLSMTREGGAAGALVAFDAGVTVVRDGTHVTAPLVRGNFLAGDLEGEGGVSLRGANGLTAASPRVAYSRNLGLASSDAGVVVQQPGLVINAAGFTANVVDETAEFQQADTRFTPR